MTELENNLESTEVEVSEEKQPTDGAQKGDAKPVKQGSSDAEKIESGKAEVVKPEENPVDKAVDAQKKAENVKPVSGDAHQKNAGKGDSQPKLAKVSEEVIYQNTNVKLDGVDTPNHIILCTLKNAEANGGKCPKSGAKLEKPAYLVKWSRFGNVSKYKWNGSDWNRQ